MRFPLLDLQFSRKHEFVQELVYTCFYTIEKYLYKRETCICITSPSSTTVGCFVGTDQSDAASETDRMLIAALKAAASKAEGDGHVPVIETILITMGQLGRSVLKIHGILVLN